jgi:hypothetical protein
LKGIFIVKNVASNQNSPNNPNFKFEKICAPSPPRALLVQELTLPPPHPTSPNAQLMGYPKVG